MSIIRTILSILSVLSIIVIFYISVIAGVYYLIVSHGQEDGILQNFEDNINVTRNDSFFLGSYKIVFFDKCNAIDNSSGCDGYAMTSANGTKSIHIKTGMSKLRTINVCNHEICHHIMNENADTEEFLCSRIEKYLNHPICEALRRLI